MFRQGCIGLVGHQHEGDVTAPGQCGRPSEEVFVTLLQVLKRLLQQCGTAEQEFNSSASTQILSGEAGAPGW